MAANFKSFRFVPSPVQVRHQVHVESVALEGNHEESGHQFAGFNEGHNDDVSLTGFNRVQPGSNGFNRVQLSSKFLF